MERDTPLGDVETEVLVTEMARYWVQHQHSGEMLFLIQRELDKRAKRNEFGWNDD